MNEVHSPKIVRVTQGVPPVPEPHDADYSSIVPDSAYDLIDELCPQEQLASGRTIKRFEW